MALTAWMVGMGELKNGLQELTHVYPYDFPITANGNGAL
jgi:hypothetical protein